MIEKTEKGRAKLTVNIGSGKTRKRRSKIVEYSGKKDLERQYQDFEDEVRSCRRTDLTLYELTDSYIINREILGIKATTIHGYRSDMERICCKFGHLKAYSLTTYMLNQYIVELTKKYSPKTIANTIFFLNACYEYAIKTGQLTTNPCRNATLPKRNKREIKTLGKEEMMVFLKALDNERLDFKVGYKLALLCGLRRSEVLGLLESDINLNFKTISINKTRHSVSGKEYVQTTKTERSHRTLALPNALCEDIAQLIDEHHSKPYIKSKYLIQDGFGNPMSPSQFSTTIMRIEERANIDAVSAHGLRHTFATLLNANGVDIAQISAELGHSNITTTLNTYTHVFGDATRSSRGIADLIDETLEKEHVQECENNLPPMCHFSAT